MMEALETRLAPAISFAHHQTFAEGGGTGVVVADFNGDGRPDIATYGISGGGIQVSLNTTPPGAGTVSFSPMQTLPSPHGVTNSLTVADLNGDGKADLILTNQGGVDIFVNTTATGAGAVSFALAQQFSPVIYPGPVIVADVNGDGKPDLLIGNSDNSQLSVLLNTTPAGSATLSFAAAQTFSVPNAGIAMGDLNGDGKPDLVATNYSPSVGAVWVMMNITPTGSMTVSFAAPQSFATGTNPSEVVLADLNGDGKPDLAVTNLESGTISVLVNQTAAGSTTAAFAAQQTFGAGISPLGIVAVDLNGDGRSDLAITNNNSPDTVTVFQNQTTAGAASVTFAAPQTFAVGGYPWDLAVADFNGDGHPDLAVANQADGTMSVLLNTTVATPEAYTQSVAVTQGQARSITLTGVAPNGDPLKFTVTANPSHGSLSGFNSSTGQVTYTPTGSYTGPDSFSFTVTDTSANVTGAAAAVSLTVALPVPPTPPVVFAPQQTFTFGGGSSIAAADFNGDGKPDLALSGGASLSVQVVVNTTSHGSATASFSAPITLTVPSLTNYVTAGDLNGDGKPDLIVADNNGLSIFVNTTPTGAATPTFAPVQTFGVGNNSPAGGVTLADLNGDGKPDVLIATGNDVRVLMNETPTGSLTLVFAAAMTFTVGNVVTRVAVGDLNGDGKPDLAVGEGLDGQFDVAVLLNQTATGSMTPAFSAPGYFVVGQNPGDLAMVDLNGSGKPDLVVANSYSGTTSMLLNTMAPGATVPAFTVQQTFATGTGSSSIAVADLNGDGRPDLAFSTDGFASVLTNLPPTPPALFSLAALQTYALGPYPKDMASADFNGDGRPDLAVINWGDHTFSVLMNTVPFPPLANSQSVLVGQGLSKPVTLTGSAFNGDPFTFQVASGPAHGTLSGTAPNFTYTPTAGFTGADSFTFTVTDTTTGLVSSPATVSIAVVPPPAASPQAVTVAQDTAKAITLTGTAPNGDAFTFAVTVNPSHGTLSGLNSSTGAVTYTPAAGFTGSDSFQFTVTDAASTLTSPAATVSLNVAAPPFASPQSVSALAGQAVVITLTGTAPAGHTLAFALITAPAHGTLTNFNTSTGQVTYKSDPTYTGADGFQFTVTDTTTNLTSGPAMVSVAVAPSPAVVAQFAGQGVWQFNATSGTWTQLTPATASLLATDRAGDVASEFPGYGVWLYQRATGWKQIHPADVSLLAMNAVGMVAAEFPGYGVGEYTPSGGWRLLTAANAALLAIDTQGDVAAEFPGYGVWQYKTSTGWRQLHPVDVTLLAMDAFGDIAADFPGYGVGAYKIGSGWRLLNGTQASALAIDFSGDVVANFPGAGVGEFPSAGGGRLLTGASAGLLGADAFGEVFASFAGYGVWEYDPTRGWFQVRAADASLLAVA